MSSNWLIGVGKLVLVALLWGCTNPALNRASKEKEKQHTETTPTGESTPKQPESTPSIFALLINYRFLLPYLLNQTGSVLYLHCLSQLSVSFAVPTANALTMVITAITAAAMGEKQNLNGRVIFGMTCILVGVSMCVLAQQGQTAAITEPSVLVTSTQPVETQHAREL